MTHDPLCLALDDEGFSVAYFGPAGSDDHIDCVSCNFIARVRSDQTESDIRKMRSELRLFGTTKIVRNRLIAAIRRKE